MKTKLISLVIIILVSAVFGTFIGYKLGFSEALMSEQIVVAGLATSTADKARKHCKKADEVLAYTEIQIEHGYETYLDYQKSGLSPISKFKVGELDIDSAIQKAAVQIQAYRSRHSK